MLATGIERRCQAEAASNLRYLVRQDIAEHIGGYYHIELALIPHQRYCHGIDDFLLISNVRGARCNASDAIKKQAIRDSQHVCFMNCCDVLSSAASQSKC